MPWSNLDLNVLWFLLLGVLLIGYAVLDGFDLGVGILHIAARNDHERRVMINSIGPLWDGNEVWLVTFGGAMFAAFPHAYATIFSGFYLAFMLLLFALIFRAVSIEFRSKESWLWWRTMWDYGFFAGSALAALLFGVAVGNAMIGLPIGADMELRVGLLGLLSPYPIMVGLMTVAMFAMHGAIYLYLKTEGQLQERIYSWMWHTFGLFMVAYILTTIFTLALVPDQALRNLRAYPVLWVVPVLGVLFIANIPRSIYLRKPFMAFVSSCCTIASLIGLFSIALFPNLVTSSQNPAHSLTIYNAASSAKTLQIMAIIALLGMPFVLAYTSVVYWVFRGKVQIGEHSY